MKLAIAFALFTTIFSYSKSNDYIVSTKSYTSAPVCRYESYENWVNSIVTVNRNYITNAYYEPVKWVTPAYKVETPLVRSAYVPVPDTVTTYYYYRKDGEKESSSVNFDKKPSKKEIESAKSELKELKKLILGNENEAVSNDIKEKAYNAEWLKVQLKITRMIELDNLVESDKEVDQSNGKKNEPNDTTKKIDKESTNKNTDETKNENIKGNADKKDIEQTKSDTTKINETEKNIQPSKNNVDESPNDKEIKKSVNDSSKNQELTKDSKDIKSDKKLK